MKSIYLLLLLGFLWSCNDEGTTNNETSTTASTVEKAVEKQEEKISEAASKEQALLFAVAIEEEKKGALAKAAEIHEKILTINSNYYKSYPVLAGLYSSLGKKREAIQYGKKALEHNPDDIDLLNTMGMVYLEAGDFANALSYFNTVIQLNPRFAYAYNNKGYILLQQEEYDLALLSIEKSLALDMDNAYAYRNAAICYHKKGEKEACCEALVAASNAKFRHRLKEELESLKADFCR